MLVLLSVPCGLRCEALSPERVEQLHQEIRDTLAAPQAGDRCFILREWVGWLTPQAGREWSRLFLQETTELNQPITEISSQFTNRAVAHSGGQLIKLTEGTSVQVLECGEKSSKIKILEGSSVNKICSVDTLCLRKIDPNHHNSEESQECLSYIHQLAASGELDNLLNQKNKGLPKNKGPDEPPLPAQLRFFLLLGTNDDMAIPIRNILCGRSQDPITTASTDTLMNWIACSDLHAMFYDQFLTEFIKRSSNVSPKTIETLLKAVPQSSYVALRLSKALQDRSDGH